MQQAAAKALGDREGAVLVMDPITGRLRAIVNPRLAFEQAFPPGSSIKTFTALTALRLGLIDSESRILCPGRYTRNGVDIVCSHPKSKTPFNLEQALAYSCNCFFAAVAERLSASAFASSLAQFGFGARTGVNAGGESAGSIRGGEWRVRDALGEGKGLLATPIQMLAAYSALFNGGHLLRPRHAQADGFAPEERAAINVESGPVASLIRGCRGAVEYGTAEKSGLADLPMFIFGKTGTSSDSNGFRRQGWFVALAADSPDADASNDMGSVSPESLRLAVLVFARRSHGSECADVARKVFDAYVKFEDRGSTIEDSSQNPQSDIRNQQSLRVRSLREGRTETISLEDYVLGVLSMEASTEDELEALKAQAVVSRTFALRNLGRHSSEGYDLCSNTHCQQYSNDGSRTRDQIRRAVDETTGELVTEQNGDPIDAYFHAACGGATASIESLWKVPAASYLRGVRDDYCAAMPGREWTDEIRAARLVEALTTDTRTDIGRRLDDVVVTKRDASGRAELITLEGERRRHVRGWEFKMIVGRALGWNVLKSSRFQVSRSGSSFVFRGSGFGHGLGLCQRGAHVMARRGVGYQQILEHYFPGTGVRPQGAGNAPTGGRGEGVTRRRGEPETDGGGDGGTGRRGGESRIRRASIWVPGRGGESEAEYVWLPAAFSLPAREGSNDDRRELTIKSEHFRISYTAGVQRGEIESVLRTLEAADKDMRRRLTLGSMNLPEAPAVDVTVHVSTQSFTAATGQPWFAAGATRGRRIQLQPLAVLRRRRILMTTLRHEYAHAVIETVGEGRTPRWLAEGLAIHFAGESAMLRRFESKNRMPLDELERRLERPPSAAQMRALYADAGREIRALIQKEGESRVWRRAAAGNRNAVATRSPRLPYSTNLGMREPTMRSSIARYNSIVATGATDFYLPLPFRLPT
ncbi:MAG: SpoIID/LytB domain-containing protein [Blastocatellia bacterium]